MNPIYQLQYSNNTLEVRKVRQCMIQTPKTCRKKSRRIYETGLTQLSWHSVLRTPMASMPFTPIASTPLLASSLSALGWGSAAQADMQTSLFIHFTPTNSSSATTRHLWDQQLYTSAGPPCIPHWSLWNIDTLQVKTWDGRPPGVGGRRHLVRHWPDRKMDVQQEFIDFWVGQPVL